MPPFAPLALRPFPQRAIRTALTADAQGPLLERFITAQLEIYDIHDRHKRRYLIHPKSTSLECGSQGSMHPGLTP